MSDAVPVLETERLILRGFTLRDADAFAAIWAHRDVARYITGRPSSPADSWSRLLRLAGGWPLLGYGYWAVVEAESGRLAGMAGLADFQREIDAEVSGLPEAGWVFHPDFHGRGYATEAMRAALEWADAEIDASRSWCLIHPKNAASLNVAAKLGYGGAQDVAFDGAVTRLLWRGRGT